MAQSQPDPLVLVQKYQQLVIAYETLDHEIDHLIMAHGGTSDKMPPDALATYRQLARQRDDIQNEMRELEQELQFDDES
jgi:hypothetical protein